MPTSSFDIRARRFDSIAEGPQFQVNSFTASFQRNPAVAVDASGSRFMVAWESRFSTGIDSSSYSIQGQRFVPEPDTTLALGAGIALLATLGRRGPRIRHRAQTPARAESSARAH
ncbi:MAG TPA: hypothetical protein VMS55_16805 [Myxococcota bacterium]|nr:hypothetical protein [Myxococcota bacterium]